MKKKHELNIYEQQARKNIIKLIDLYCDGSQQKMANKTGINKASISQYVNGKNVPSNMTADKIAQVFDVNPAWVMGFDTHMSFYDDPTLSVRLAQLEDIEEILKKEDYDLICEDYYSDHFSITKNGKTIKSFSDNELLTLYEHLRSCDSLSADALVNYTFISFPNRHTATIPVLGSIPAGTPLDAVQDIRGYIDVPTAWVDDHGALIVIGDSMSPKYLDGDTVIFRIQPDCENGQDCVVYVNGYDATLKKVIKTETGIILQPLNPEFEPIICGSDNPATILGVVVELRRKV